MAKNDVILLDGILDQRLADCNPSNQRDEVFEYFGFEQVLKNLDLSRDEINSGWVDGRDDGGIDGFFILVNGHLLSDAGIFIWPKSSASIEIYILTCKHHATFQQAPLNSLLASIQEIFDFSLDKHQLKGDYSEDLLAARDLLLLAYKRLAANRPDLKFRFAYISRGDTNDVGENVRARALQIEALISSFFSSSSVEFAFIGASELVELHRQTKSFSLDLPFLEHLASGRDSYVLLTQLDSYCKFVTDEQGQLRRYLFDSNVRDYLGETGVNEDILESLQKDAAPDFWWLNNGVTILATHATVIGKTIQLQNIQIVNGLQTTESIYKHFQSGSNASTSRALLVKAIISSDTQVRDQIIHATNNQNAVEISSLHATDKIQRDIEQILEKHDWYYERRKNYYRNIGKPSSRFVSPIYIASCYVSLVLWNPSLASNLKTKFMRKPESYSKVFSDRASIEIWPAIVDIFKQVEEHLANLRLPQMGHRERFLSNWRSLVSYLVVVRLSSTFAISQQSLINIDKTKISKELVAEIWSIIKSLLKPGSAHPYRKPSFVMACCKELEKVYGLTGKEVVGRQQLSAPSKIYSVNEAFISMVNELLPEQPWEVGIHFEIASKLECKPGKVTTAISRLIESGQRHRQRDGVVFDRQGGILAYDSSRVSDPTLVKPREIE